MDNQHKKIKGYRDLSQEEIDLMNKLKEKAEEVKLVLEEILKYREGQWEAWYNITEDDVNGLTEIQLLESERNLHIAKENLQQGFMWAVRGVALPETF